jgi:hypothetical protein
VEGPSNGKRGRSAPLPRGLFPAIHGSCRATLSGCNGRQLVVPSGC